MGSLQLSPRHITLIEAAECLSYTSVFTNGGVFVPFSRNRVKESKRERCSKGSSIYDVRKFFEFLDLPPPRCHVHNSADAVPFVCFWGTPLRTSYLEAH